MYAVQCPATMLWHPAVHHSLLLLRALQQRHTLQLIESNTATPRLALPLLADCGARLRIVYTSSTPLQSTSQPHIMSAHDTVHADNYSSSSSSDRHEVFCVRQPEHLLLHYLNASAHTSSATKQATAATLSDAMNAKLQRDLSDYLDTCVIAQQLCSATDALLVALSTENTEIVRGCHARLMDLLERLEGAIEPDTITATTLTTAKAEEEHESASGSAAEAFPQATQTTTTTTPSTAILLQQQEVPLSTWPLYAMLYYFIEHAGLLRSAFPQLTQAYTSLRTNNRCVAQHHRLLQRTLAAQSSTTTSATGKTHSASSAAVAHESVGDKESVPRYPQADFLHDVQRRLAAYTSAAEERLCDGVTGDGGPLRYRTSGGRFGLQTVAARLPWTMQQSKLPRP